MQNIHILINIIGQILFGGYFFWNGIKHFKDHKSYTMYAQAMGVPFASIMVYLSGLLIFLGGLGVMFNIQKTIYIPWIENQRLLTNGIGTCTQCKTHV